jgi:putative ABC transport system permease protein
MLEACCISLIGGILGVLASFAVSPVITSFSIRMEMSVTGALLAMGFSLVTGTIFGFYPAWKASRLVPVEALSSE